ncbi:MAG: hypothetical protein ACE1ZD_02825, partial [Dehalococcoidia bacterium]
MPSLYADGFSTVSAKALEAYSKKHAAREQGLRISRQVIQLSANAIRAVHRWEFERAQKLIAEGKTHLAESTPILETN